MRIFLFLLATIASILSQLPMVVDTSFGNMLKAFWLIPFAVSILDFKTIRLRGIIGNVLFLLLFSLYCMIMQSFTLHQYMGADLRNIAISCLVFVTSYLTFISKGQRLLKILPVCLLLLGLFMSVFISINYDLIGSLQSSLYVYEAKNSMSTILTSIIVIAIFYFKPKNFIIKNIKLVSVIFITIVVLLLRSRATILGLVFAIFYYVISINNKTLKRIAIALLVATIVAVIAIPSLNAILIDQIFLAGRDAVDANELSSGRVERFPEMFQLISDSPIIGNGNIYFDCMPLVILAQYGIIGAFIVFVFLAAVFVRLFKNRQNNEIQHTAFVLYCVFLINSLFEAQAPFGPGIKCFILWMMIGFAYAEPLLQSNSVSD